MGRPFPFPIEERERNGPVASYGLPFLHQKRDDHARNRFLLDEEWDGSVHRAKQGIVWDGP